MIAAEVIAMGDEMFDVVIVGGGAAGLNAALVLGRARRRVAVIDAGEPRNAPAAHMHGFITRDGMSPAAFLAAGRAEVTGYGVTLLADRVEELAAVPGRATPLFRFALASGATVQARRVIVATGLRDELPALPGLRERWGVDVLHCPYCHGYEVGDQRLGVVGSAAFPTHVALLLRQWSPDVTLFADVASLSTDDRRNVEARGVRLIDGEVKRVVHGPDGRLAGVDLGDGVPHPLDALFIPPVFVPNDALLTGLGCVRGPDGSVPVDAFGRTAVPGVSAAGNVVDFRAQVVAAAGQGSTAGIALNGDLIEEDVAAAVAG